MAMVKKPVTGMKDILPEEMKIRDYLIGLIKETYRSYGFTPMETPCVENIENLSSKQGGENEKLIFRILKRGEKLNLETATCAEDLVDSALRYDLTVPLARYYSNNMSKLPSPFKALQIGSVFRADRPQKGRFRQFTQCDIDILGEASELAEIELILATTTCLGRIGFKGFVIRINDRRILKAMSAYSGFSEEDFEEVCIILDKMDKIGLDGVKAELLENGYAEEAVTKYLSLFEAGNDSDRLAVIGKVLTEAGDLDAEVLTRLQTIMQVVNESRTTEFRLDFDPTLVRGMGYYTGTIYEIGVEGFPGAVGGGGRYDEMVGRFAGQKTCACGFSIGFERIITILMDEGFQVPEEGTKKAILLDKDLPAERYAEVFKRAGELRASGMTVLVQTKNKNFKFQKEQLSAEGYEDIEVVYKDEWK